MGKEESPPEPQQILNSMVSERHQVAVIVIAPTTLLASLGLAKSRVRGQGTRAFDLVPAFWHRFLCVVPKIEY